jgi:hypothetical protein
MTTQVLQVHDGDTVIEIFLNNQGKIYIGEVNTDDPMAGFSIAISKDDWKEVKRYVDKRFRELDNPF